uniref:GLOBIN domain-containing protein n=1 Tax=Panagrellus redivivus TaxID=6233 RepID=A0A7E4UN46_PANRE
MGSKSATSSGGKTILKRLVLKDPGVRDVFGGFCAINGSVAAQPAATTSSTTPAGSEGHKAKVEAASFDKHGAYFADFFKFLMEHLDQPEAIAARCEAIGREHRRAKPLGFKTDFWDHFGESVIETVREYHGWRRHRQAVAATNVLLSFVVDRMRAARLQLSTTTRDLDMDEDTVPVSGRWRGHR